MRILITGVCGFVGSELALCLRERLAGLEVVGLDNLSRPGSEGNRLRLRAAGIGVRHGDLRCASDLETLGPVDWVLDAAANPSVLAGVDGRTSSRQLLEHNLIGTINLLELCRREQAGLVLISTSRVFSITGLCGLPVKACGPRFVWDPTQPQPAGFSAAGVDETFPTDPPLSLYGTSKRASELLAQEYAYAFGLPVWINRCGVLAGGGQFGVPDQGIFSYWVRAYAARRALRYIGFSGSGQQVRDALHPRDLADLVARQLGERPEQPQLFNVGGGPGNAMSLAELSLWCGERFGPHAVEADPRPRRFDVPWLVMDSRRASARFAWKPTLALTDILEEIARHHHDHPQWLELSASS